MLKSSWKKKKKKKRESFGKAGAGEHLWREVNSPLRRRHTKKTSRPSTLRALDRKWRTHSTSHSISVAGCTFPWVQVPPQDNMIPAGWGVLSFFTSSSTLAISSTSLLFVAQLHIVHRLLIFLKTLRASPFVAFSFVSALTYFPGTSPSKYLQHCKA